MPIDGAVHGHANEVRRVVAILRSGDEVSFEDMRARDGTLRRRRLEHEPDGHVSVYSDHVVIRPDGTEEVAETFRLARFTPDKLHSIAIEDD